ncbi:MAG: hypothetical protein KC912_25595 [Proteobacteria bacterium]|nr:hypothetical protein [Pseudomonadota bacterium]
MRLLLLPLLFSAPATALQRDVPRPELCAASTQVVVADVTSQETVWSATPDGGLETRVWFATHRLVRGVSEDTIELVFEGGQKGDLTHWVEHSPDFVMDARYMLFLAPHKDRGLQVLGGEAGAIRIASKPNEPGESLAKVLGTLGDCHVR